MSVMKLDYSLKGDYLAQLSCGHWWFGTGWPFVKWCRLGNQLNTWSVWIRLLGNREFYSAGRYLE